jgi:hypothetical protein
MASPLIYADFHNADPQGRLRLTCDGTISDLARLGLQLREGLAIELYMDDANAAGDDDPLRASGIVRFSRGEQCWVAEIDWDAVRNASAADAAAEGATAAPGLVLREIGDSPPLPTAQNPR